MAILCSRTLNWTHSSLFIINHRSWNKKPQEIMHHATSRLNVLYSSSIAHAMRTHVWYLALAYAQNRQSFAPGIPNCPIMSSPCSPPSNGPIILHLITVHILRSIEHLNQHRSGWYWPFYLEAWTSSVYFSHLKHLRLVAGAFHPLSKER